MIRGYWYPKCGTCQKAKKWLEGNQIAVEWHHIVETPPSRETLKQMVSASGLGIKKFFNTSGLKYKELNLKERLPTLSDDEAITLLQSDGMLIKRPLLWHDNKVTLGFKEEDFIRMWKQA